MFCNRLFGVTIRFGPAQDPFVRTMLLGQVTVDWIGMIEVLLKAVNCMMVVEAI